MKDLFVFSAILGCLLINLFLVYSSDEDAGSNTIHKVIWNHLLAIKGTEPASHTVINLAHGYPLKEQEGARAYSKLQDKPETSWTNNFLDWEMKLSNLPTE